MRTINFFLTAMITAFTLTSEGQTPSGVISINGQETDHNSDVKLVPVKTYIAFLCDEDPQVPKFTKYNGAVVGGVRISHNRDYYQAHAKELQRSAVTQVESQLKAINDKYGVFGTNTTVKGNREYLESHTKSMNLKFSADTVWLMGEKGDFSGRSWIAHDARNLADGMYYVLTTNSGKRFILSRVSCWNNVTTTETFWLETGKAVVVDDKPAPIQPKPQSTQSSGNGKDDNASFSFVDSAGRTVNIYINSAGGAGGNVVIGDITAKGGSSNNNINAGGAGRDGRDGKDGKDGMVVYAPPADQPFAPQVRGGGGQNQDRYYVDANGVYHDKAAAYFRSQGVPNYGPTGYAYYYNGGQQYMVGGNWNNGMFQPNYNQCYQYQSNGWQILGQVAAGFFNSATFCGGWNRNPGSASGPCWVGPNDRGWDNCPRQYNPTPRPNQPQVGGPRMGWSIPARTKEVAGGVQPNHGNQGGPRMGYGSR